MLHAADGRTPEWPNNPLQISGICVNLQSHVLNLTDDEIHGLIDCARGKFAAERYPFAQR